MYCNFSSIDIAGGSAVHRACACAPTLVIGAAVSCFHCPSSRFTGPSYKGSKHVLPIRHLAMGSAYRIGQTSRQTSARCGAALFLIVARSPGQRD